MTLAGWSIMIASVSCVVGLTGYCVYRVLSLPPADAEQHVRHVPHDT